MPMVITKSWLNRSSEGSKAAALNGGDEDNHLLLSDEQERATRKSTCDESNGKTKMNKKKKKWRGGVVTYWCRRDATKVVEDGSQQKQKHKSKMKTKKRKPLAERVVEGQRAPANSEDEDNSFCFPSSGFHHSSSSSPSCSSSSNANTSGNSSSSSFQKLGSSSYKRTSSSGRSSSSSCSASSMGDHGFPWAMGSNLLFEKQLQQHDFPKKQQQHQHADDSFSFPSIPSPSSMMSMKLEASSKSWENAQLSKTSRRRGLTTANTGKVVGSSRAVALASEDPYEDFRRSMVQMIVQKKLSTADELSELLEHYLTLNSPRFHHTIIQVFADLLALDSS